MEHQDSQNRYFPPKTTTDVLLLSYSLRLKSENKQVCESCMCCVDTVVRPQTHLIHAPCSLSLPASPIRRQGRSKFPALDLDSSTALSVMLF